MNAADDSKLSDSKVNSDVGRGGAPMAPASRASFLRFLGNRSDGNKAEKGKEEYGSRGMIGYQSFTSNFRSIFAPLEVPPSDSSGDNRYKAIGVEYEQNGILKSVYLKSSLLHTETSGFGKQGVRSVILAAGAIMTPKLLMNSGIGPKEALEEAGVKVLVASELVGRNLQDHPAIGITFMRTEGAGEGEGKKIMTYYRLHCLVQISWSRILIF